MIELWGADECETCVKAKELLGKTPIEWKYVDVEKTKVIFAGKFRGVIPRLVLEDGQHLVGFPAITNYVKQWMQQMGFPEGMI